MKAIAAKEAKNNFGEMMDDVQREPITIEKHGRPVAVVMSHREYQKMKLERLRAEVKKGTDQLDRGEVSNKTITEIITEAKHARNAK